MEAPIIEVGLGGFVACRALSTRNEDPAKASRPWDKGRDGFVMGARTRMRRMRAAHARALRGLLAVSAARAASATCLRVSTQAPSTGARPSQLSRT